MNKIWSIENFNVKLEDKTILSDFSMSLSNQDFVCILGESGSGKTLLLKELRSHRELWKDISVEFYFNETKNIKNWKEEFNVLSLNREWNIFLDRFLSSTDGYVYKCSIVSKLLNKPNIIFIDDLHSYINRKDFLLLVEFLKKQNIVVVYATNSIEDTIVSNYLIVIKNNQIAMEGKTELVLKEEKLMKLLGFSLPFYVNLSIQLGYYGVLDKIVYNKEDLEESIWQSN